MDAHPSNLPLDELRRKLAEVRTQAAKLEEEIAWLVTRGQMVLPPASTPALPSVPQSPAEKVALFLDLFGTRRSVLLEGWIPCCTDQSHPIRLQMLKRPAFNPGVERRLLLQRRREDGGQIWGYSRPVRALCAIRP